MKSIKTHLSVTILLSFGLLLIFSSTTVYFFTRVSLSQEFDSNLRAKAAIIMSMTEFGRNGVQFESPTSEIGEFRNMADFFYEIWEANGKICARSESLKTADLPWRFGSISKPAYWNLKLPNGKAGRAIGFRFSPKIEDEEANLMPRSEAIIVVAADREPLNRTLAILTTMLFGGGLLTLLITVPVVSFSVRRGHAPLEQLARQTSQITVNSLQSRFPVDSMPEELQPITKRLNDLLMRLEASFDRERRFSADLAHELRTPLAELRAHAEVEMACARDEDLETYGQTLQIALQMEALLTRLLELARCENGRISTKPEEISILHLAEEIWRPLASKAKRKNLVVNFKVAPNAIIVSDITLFRAILVNLLSNSVEYVPDSGIVEISWEDQTLCVRNTVIDLTPTDLPHLFKRLWRKDNSRTGNEHHGLGLALSRVYAEQLNMALTASLEKENLLILALKTSQPEGAR